MLGGSTPSTAKPAPRCHEAMASAGGPRRPVNPGATPPPQQPPGRQRGLFFAAQPQPVPASRRQPSHSRRWGSNPNKPPTRSRAIANRASLLARNEGTGAGVATELAAQNTSAMARCSSTPSQVHPSPPHAAIGPQDRWPNHLSLYAGPLIERATKQKPQAYRARAFDRSARINA